MLLRSDGAAVVAGSGRHGQADVPALPAGLRYGSPLDELWVAVACAPSA